MARGHIGFNFIFIMATLTSTRGKTREVDMCHRDIMIRRHILLTYDVRDLDLQLDDVTCQCDLYTPPYKGCVGLKADSLETHAQLDKCQVAPNEDFNLMSNTSCPVQFRLNEVIDTCTHNITVLVVPEAVLKQPFRRLLRVFASDKSGVYINCKWTASITTVTMDTSDYLTTEEPNVASTETAHTESTGFESNSTCTDVTTPYVNQARRINPSEVADQIDILIATVSAFIGAFLVVSFICMFRSSKHKGRLDVTPARDTEAATQSYVRADNVDNVDLSSTYESVFVDTCSAEIKKEGSGSYSEPFSNDLDPTYAPVLKRHSNEGYDNVAFQA